MDVLEEICLGHGITQVTCAQIQLSNHQILKPKFS